MLRTSLLGAMRVNFGLLQDQEVQYDHALLAQYDHALLLLLAGEDE